MGGEHKSAFIHNRLPPYLLTDFKGNDVYSKRRDYDYSHVSSFFFLIQESYVHKGLADLAKTEARWAFSLT